MRHRVQKKKLNMDTDHRKSVLRNLATDLILHGKLETTLAKAKAVKPIAERLVTRAKRGYSVGNERNLRTTVTSQAAIDKLFKELAPTFSLVPGGYTKIIKTRNRVGDNAQLAQISWTDKKE